MNPLFLSRSYHKLLALVHLLPLKLQLKIISSGRSYFMSQFVKPRKILEYDPLPELAINMWGIKFRTPLANSAGMFKNGEGYDIVAALGAGAFIGGTSTYNSRIGNCKAGVKLPFVNLPRSGMAINWLGLPNHGDDVLSQQTITSNKLRDCPIGWSVMRSPDYPEAEGMQKLINSLYHYHDNLQIDFIEINESCPNVKTGTSSIFPRLELIRDSFLQKRTRNFPVVIKLSNDIAIDKLASIIERLVSLGFDGINLGNTSTDYEYFRNLISSSELAVFDYFTSNFGGGVSGVGLKKRSLALCAEASEIIQRLRPDHEFHIIRSGGITCLEDILESKDHGVSFNQWYTGFFDAYSTSGDNIYKEFWKNI